jgi:hypothetical protein
MNQWTDDRGNQVLARALAYARHGWPVFPCRPGGKEPATLHGHVEATTEPQRIADWWRAVPGRNVAIATGAPGPDVLDIDVRPAGSGYPAWRRLQHAGLAAGPVALVRTPSGGLHAYYSGTGQRSGRIPAEHLDFKATGGYVLDPPSRIGEAAYRLIGCPAGRHSSLDWAATCGLLAPRYEGGRSGAIRHAQTDPGRLAAWVATLPEGNRNAGLFWAACRAVEAGQHQTLANLAVAAQGAGLPETEVRRTISSAVRRATRHDLEISGRNALPGAEAAS